MKNLTWQNPEQLFVAQELINKVKSKCCGIKDDLAEKKDFCDEYVNYSCGGSCDELDYYLDAWKYIIDHIISGQITESTLDSWLEYFDECYYQEETTVEKWHKAN